MSIVRFQDACLDFGHGPVLDHVNLVITKGEHIALIGRNGEGKSTLLKLIAQQQELDKGNIQYQTGLNIQRLEQTVPTHITGTVYEFILQGLGEVGHALATYPQALNDPKQLEAVQTVIEQQDGWAISAKADTILSKMQLEPNAEISRLSGGMKRRVLLAQALLTEPDILLLDEPTNHLDMASIVWLEKFLANYHGTFILISHDRTFLESTTNKILELDRGQLSSFSGNYSYYLKHKAEAIHAEEKANQNFDKKLAQEETWIRQGIKARRTRNEGRVRALKAMRQERLSRREQQKKMTLDVSKLESSGKLVFDLQSLSYGYDEKTLINNFSALVLRGDKIGLVGANGCGKTTLLKMLVNQLTPSSGNVVQGTQLSIAYFDQMRAQLDESLTALDNVSQGRDMIEAFGKTQHIISYMKSFLFSPDRARAPVTQLSGGEKNRLLLAKLFTQPANLMILDEPTNDLDIESLEILESFLVEYPGTVLIVSHDRAFLENVVTSTWAFIGDGQIIEYPGEYRSYLDLIPVKTNEADNKSTKKPEKSKLPSHSLTHQEQKELKNLPGKIEKIEQQLEALQEKLADPMLYQSDQQTKISKLNQEVNALESQLEQAMTRWEQLENS